MLDVHGGTTEADIIRTFARAEELLVEKKTSRVFVFLDEVNTCPHMGLFTEVIVRRSINGRAISDGIQVLAALNPYRLRKDRGEDMPGLVYQLHGATATPDPMRALVYRVHPVPATLQCFIFDFGALSADKERMYIESMSNSVVKYGSNEEKKFIAELIVIAQEYIRKYEEDASAASLRDVRRCLNLINWFYPSLKASNEAVSSLGFATIVSLAFTYNYRIPSAAGAYLRTAAVLLLVNGLC